MDLLEKIRGVFQSGANQAQQSLRGLGNRVVNNAQWAGQQVRQNAPQIGRTMLRTTANAISPNILPAVKSANILKQNIQAAPKLMPQYVANAKANPVPMKAFEGLVEGTTLGLKDVNYRPSKNIGEKLAYGTGYTLGMLNPASPFQVTAQTISKIPAVASTIAGVGKNLAPTIAKGGIKAIGAKGLVNVAQGLPYTAAYAGIRGMGGQGNMADVPTDLAFDFGLGALPAVGALAVGARKGARGFDKKIINQAKEILGNEARESIGRFAQIVEMSPNANKKNLGALGDEIQSMAETLWGKKAMYLTNKQLKNAFDVLLYQLDNTKGYNRDLAFGLSTQNVRDAMDGKIPTKPPTDPLIEEARKYKSAEEFVNNMAKEFNASSGKPRDITKQFYTSQDKEYVKNFGEIIDNYHVGAKNPLDLTQYKTKEISYKTLEKTLAKRSIDISGIVPEEMQTGVKDPLWFWLMKYKDITTKAKQAGYDLIKLTEKIDEQTKEVGSSIVLDPNIVKTKSQLTDIWNKANKGARPQFSPTTMTRQEKVAKDMLRRGDITGQQYNEIAAKNEGVKPISITNKQSETILPKELERSNTSYQPFSLPQKPQGQGQQLQIGEQTNQTGGMGQLPPVPPKQTGFGDSQQKSSGGSVTDFIGQVKSNLNKLYTKTVDRFHPISILAKEAGQEQATRNAMTGYYGAGSKAEYHVDYELTPILKEHNLDDLRKAAIAFRDLELSSRGIQGSNKGDPQAVLKDMETRLGADKVKQIGETLKKLYAYQDKMVKEYLVNTGVINKQAYENMRKNNQFYVPFKRVMDQVDKFLGVVPQTKNAGSVNYQDVIRGIKGSAREIVDPIESIIEASYKMVNVGQRQKVAQQIVNLGKTAPGMITRTVGEVGNKPHISLFEDGKVVNYLVPEDIAIAAKGLTDDGVNTLVKILQAPTKVFRASATGLNPEFFVPNVARDIQSAWVNYGLNPLDWVSGLAHYIKKDDMYKEFLKSGGKTSFVAIDKPQIRKNVQDIGGIGSKGIAILHPRELLKYVQNLSEASEMGTRMSLFEKQFNKGIKEGLDRNEAAMRAVYAAQEGTVNFARRGADTKSISAIYAFLNARVQGIDRLIRSVKNDPKGAGTRLGFMIAAPALGLYAWNRNFESYDDERVVSKSDKQNNFIIMLSDKPIQSLGGAQYLKIPKAEVGKLANPLESFLSMLDGKDADSKEALLLALKGFSPVDNIGDLIPTALRPPVEVAANKSFFFNTYIVPDYKVNYPAKYQYSSYTAPIYKMIGDKLNISPAKIQAIVEGYATGWAKIAETTMRPLVPQQYKTERDKQGQPINRTPIIRRVLGGERRTEGEQQAIDEKRVKSIDFQINDIKSGVNRNDLPMNIGIQQIQRLRQEQEKLKGATTQPSSRGTYYFKDDEGKLKEVDLSKQIIAPTLTGNKELDKIAMSKYRSALTRRANDIYALYEAGQMSFSEASKQIEALIATKNSTYVAKAKKPKKVSVKLTKVKAPKIKAFKVKLPKLKKMKQPKIKLLKNKPNTITMKGIKLT